MPGPSIRLPRPPFQWTLDNVALILNMSEANLKLKLVHFDHLTAGPRTDDYLTAHDIAPLGEKSDWRISETELLRWLRRKGYRVAFDRLY